VSVAYCPPYLLHASNNIRPPTYSLSSSLLCPLCFAIRRVILLSRICKVYLHTQRYVVACSVLCLRRAPTHTQLPRVRVRTSTARRDLSQAVRGSLVSTRSRFCQKNARAGDPRTRPPLPRTPWSPYTYSHIGHRPYIGVG